jgi:hypothetical protein
MSQGKLSIIIEVRGNKFELSEDVHVGSQLYDAIQMEEALLMLLPNLTKVIQAVSGDVRTLQGCAPEIKARGFQITQNPPPVLGESS